MKKSDKWVSTQEAEVNLIRKIAQRDTVAFAAFYDRMSKTGFTFLSRLLKDRVESEDVLQETFWQVWRQAAAYEHTLGSPMVWVLTMARSLGIGRLRQLFKHRRRDAFSLVDIASMKTTADDINRSMGKALLEIKKEEADAMSMSFFDGFTHEEIATHLDIPIWTIKTRICLGMSHLHEVLQNAPRV